MKLDFGELQTLLTQETFVASDCVATHLSASGDEYDRIFSIVFETLTPLMTRDVPIDISARAALIRGVAQRTQTDASIHVVANEAYSTFLTQTLSSEHLDFIGGLNQQDLQDVTVDTPLTLFYGPWMPEISLKIHLLSMGKVARDMGMYHSKQKNRRLNYDHMTLVDKCNHLWSACSALGSISAEEFRLAVAALEFHPNFNLLVDRLLSPEEKILSAFTFDAEPLLQFEHYIDGSQSVLRSLRSEIARANETFRDQKIQLVTSSWSACVSERCSRLLDGMTQNILSALDASNYDPPKKHKMG